MKLFKNKFYIGKCEEIFRGFQAPLIKLDTKALKLYIPTHICMTPGKLPEHLVDVDLSLIDIENPDIVYDNAEFIQYYFHISVEQELLDQMKDVGPVDGETVYQALLEAHNIDWIIDQRSADLNTNEELSEKVYNSLELKNSLL